jgi:hypothetical protein
VTGRLPATLAALAIAFASSSTGSDDPPRADDVDPGWIVLGLQASFTPGEPYVLRIHHRPGRKGQKVDAILVSAEPSRTLLVAQWNREPGESERALVAARKPIATTSIDVNGESRFTTRIPFDPRGSTGFSLEVFHDGEILPVFVNARTDMTRCGMSIAFEPATFLSALHLGLRGIVVPLHQGYKVCCSCEGECRNCIACVEQPPSPECACPGCMVSCT